MRAYPEYKKSGETWLGSVPAHWQIVQSRRYFAERKERARENDAQMTASQKYGIILQSDFEKLEGVKVMQVTKNAEILKHVEPGDFVISMRSFQGGLELSHDRGCVSSAYVALEPRDGVRANFYRYLFKSVGYIQALQATTNLVRDGQALRYANFVQVCLPLPPLPEQRAIAGFLDRETAKIDALVEEQRRLIALLKEKRQAVISHAVTKGLDLAAPMKPSGIDWLGDIPAHWNFERLTTVAKFSQGKAHEPFFDDDGEFVCVTARFVSTGGKMVKYCNERISPARVGDIAMVMSDLPNGRALARAFLIDDQANYAINQRVAYISVLQGDPRYFAYQLDRHMELLRYDDGMNQTHLPNRAFTKLKLLIPSSFEQARIADYLDEATGVYDGLTAEAERAITLLQERRSALISAAVTGKIDVRDTTTNSTEAA